MAKGKKKGKGKQKGQARSGSVLNHPVVGTLKEGGLLLLTAIAAGGAGAALGKHSLLAGIPVTLYGIHQKNQYIIAAGLGISLGTAKVNPSNTSSGVNGFDVKQIASEAKERAGEFFTNFKAKLYLPTATGNEQTAGLAGGEKVSYFINPHNRSGDIDMSALDQVQQQIAEMGKGNLSDVDREF